MAKKQEPIEQVCSTCSHAVIGSNGVITCMFGYWQTFASNHCEQWSNSKYDYDAGKRARKRKQNG